MLIRKAVFVLLLLGVTLFIVSFAPSVYANHSWNGYHWARISNPFTLKLGDNVSSNWKSFLGTTSSDWSQSLVLDTTIVPGTTTARRCRPTSGRVEICNYKYGKKGWLGMAQIWVNGSHIIQGVTKLNDTYFNTAQYNTVPWRNLVLCQEVGHTLGLDHQDENFSNTNLGTCMDYTDDPSGVLKTQLSNEHPNTHDYEELATIYQQHIDSFTTVQSGARKFPLGLSIVKEALNSDFENRSEWGRELKNNRKVALYERDFGGGHKLFTFIILAQE